MIPNGSRFYWAIIGAPIIQEIIFRFLPYQFLVLNSNNNFWNVGFITSILYALIHWYFGKWFTIYTFFLGLLFWFVIGNFGLVVAIIVHSLVNIIDFKIGLRKKLKTL